MRAKRFSFILERNNGRWFLHCATGSCGCCFFSIKKIKVWKMVKEVKGDVWLEHCSTRGKNKFVYVVHILGLFHLWNFNSFFKCQLDKCALCSSRSGTNWTRRGNRDNEAAANYKCLRFNLFNLFLLVAILSIGCGCFVEFPWNLI